MQLLFQWVAHLTVGIEQPQEDEKNSVISLQSDISMVVLKSMNIQW